MYAVHVYTHKCAGIRFPTTCALVCVCVARVNDVCSGARLSFIQQQMLANCARCVFDQNKASWLCVCVRACVFHQCGE